jgi:hypothetical protein
MSTPRAVRIPRATKESPFATVRMPVPSTHPTTSLAERVRANRAGTQRAVRLTLLYLVVLAILYVAFVAYGRTVPGGTSSGMGYALTEFGLLALVLGVVGGALTLSPAPRAVERFPDGFVVVGRWGRRTAWTPLPKVSVRLVRRYPAGFLSKETVDLVEVSASGKRPRGYLVESGLLSEHEVGRT